MTNQANHVAIEAAEKDIKALELRKAGATFDMIAKQLGYKSASGAHKAVKAGIKRILQEPAEAVITLEVERLDAMLLGVWSDARRGNQGAIDRVLRIMERRARLLGLDKPVKQEHSGNIGNLIILPAKDKDE